jgi:hypothetical protein
LLIEAKVALPYGSFIAMVERYLPFTPATAQHFMRRRREGRARKATSPGVIPIFLARAVAYDGDECLLWPFARDRGGYGHYWEAGVYKKAHRTVCEAQHGPPPPGKPEAAHTCGNGHLGCVTGRHLAWENRIQNAQDTVAQGRSTRGERHPMVKLTEADVLAIRASSLPSRALAGQFGIGQPHVYQIRTRRRWRHIE